MRGHERIIEARMQGAKPDCAVWVDVGSDVWFQDLQHGIVSGRRRWVQGCKEANVTVAPGESTRTADWSWCIGLRVQITGDDYARVMSAVERIRAAGAVLVGAACAGYAAGLWVAQGGDWLTVCDLEVQ